MFEIFLTLNNNSRHASRPTSNESIRPCASQLLLLGVLPSAMHVAVPSSTWPLSWYREPMPDMCVKTTENAVFCPCSLAQCAPATRRSPRCSVLFLHQSLASESCLTSAPVTARKAIIHQQQYLPAAFNAVYNIVQDCTARKPVSVTTSNPALSSNSGTKRSMTQRLELLW